ncbi:MAG: hypothetical protein IPJ79_11755 [Bacteroidetes bacterium]|nr:hypothetical protein [Bacteroidota bacterium]
MNIKYKSMLTACFFLALQKVNAQNEIDALRYSQINFGTTARSLSMGGAFGALGADFSSLSANPAGIALYRKSEFTFTPHIENKSTTSKYLNTETTDNRVNFGMGNVGLVWAFPKEKKDGGWKGVGFGIGYNRLQSFNNSFSFEGRNNSNSQTQYFAEIANGTATGDITDYLPFDAGLAYNQYLINPDSVSTNGYYATINNGQDILQKGTITSKGSHGEVAISFGGNYDDKIYMGATIGIPYIRYVESNIYEEIDDKNVVQDTVDAFNGVSDFRSYKFENNLTTVGTGINLKLGLIYRINDWVRLGAAIHTPTYYEMNDTYSSTMQGYFGSGNISESVSPDGTYSYNLTTPFRAIGSTAILFQGKGLLSFDYEFLDYGSANLKASDYGFSDENRTIQNAYTTASNFKIGTEWKYKIFSFRAGAAIFSGPFDGEFNADKSNLASISYTGGIGFKEKNFFLDLGYAFTKSNSFYRPYLLSGEVVDGSTNTIKNHRLAITAGFKF